MAPCILSLAVKGSGPECYLLAGEKCFFSLDAFLHHTSWDAVKVVPRPVVDAIPGGADIGTGDCLDGIKKVPIRTPEGPEHYAFDGQKHLIPNSVYFTYFDGWGSVHEVSDEWLDAIPRGNDLPSKTRLELGRPTKSRAFWNFLGQCNPGEEFVVSEQSSTTMGVTTSMHASETSSESLEASYEFGGDWLGAKAGAGVSVSESTTFGSSVSKSMAHSKSTMLTHKIQNPCPERGTMYIFQFVLEVEYEGGALRQLGTTFRETCWRSPEKEKIEPDVSPEEQLRLIFPSLP